MCYQTKTSITTENVGETTSYINLRWLLLEMIVHHPNSEKYFLNNTFGGNFVNLTINSKLFNHSDIFQHFVMSLWTGSLNSYAIKLNDLERDFYFKLWSSSNEMKVNSENKNSNDQFWGMDFPNFFIPNKDIRILTFRKKNFRYFDRELLDVRLHSPIRKTIGFLYEAFMVFAESSL